MKAEYLTFHGNDKEDQVLYEGFDLPQKGVFIDIGAGPDGIQGSNSYFFEKNGWHVVTIDADPRNYEAIKKNREHFYGVAITSNPPGKVVLHTTESPDLSGLITKGEPVEVEGVALESILEKENIEKIDIISIDTEGTEIDVWKSFDWKKHKPSIVIVEAVTTGVINEDIPQFFYDMGYVWRATIGPNLIFALEVQNRNPHKIVYGSSYDRGLEHLVRMWPDIRTAVPDAELRIFYGWDLFDIVARGNPQMSDWKARMQELMRADGIIELGRISHGAVEKEFENAGIWAYPTHFGEISCITAMKAQCYGSVPVVINYAALEETVKYGIKIDGDIYDQETKDEFKTQLIALLQDPDRQEEMRVPMMEWAKKEFPWSTVAEKWTEEFKA